MRYTMLLWPHANARYQAETEKLARAELEVTLARLGVEYTWEEGGVGGLPALDFAARAFTDAEARVLSRHSLLYALFERREDGALLPLFGREAPRVGGDLPGILKYKGKTNEVFTQLLINLAWLAGNMPEKAHLFDPMCGRGTTLFVAINRGWDATGADIDRAALREAEQFFKRYLEYHRFKHTTKRGSLTLRGKKSAPYTAFTLPAGTLRLAEAEAARAREAFGAGTFDLLCADLPYGVQHGANMPLEALLRLALPAWAETLKHGAAMALSFNAQTLPARKVRALLAGAGLRVLEGGPYDHFEHWVEQAVTRDIAVAVRP